MTRNLMKDQSPSKDAKPIDLHFFPIFESRHRNETLAGFQIKSGFDKTDKEFSMTHFGVMCPDLGGHLGPTLSLACALHRRGHRVTFVQSSGLSRATIEASGMSFRSYGDPAGAAAKSLALQLENTGGWRGFKATIDAIRQSTAQCLDAAPQLLREERVEALLVDEVLPYGPTLAELLGLPYVVLSNALLLQADRTIPPFFTTWKFRVGWWGIVRNGLAYIYLRRTARPLQRDISRHRARLGLDAHAPRGPFANPVARISQQPAEFDFPRRRLPDRMYFVGSMSDPSLREPVEFPFDRLDGRPLIYASLGTLLATRRNIFHLIADACAPLNVQLVISLGGRGAPQDLGTLPGSPLVVHRAPQLEILKRATICITHAGMNTTLECLAAGVPMVALPIVNDGPGVAARIAWTGCGLFLKPSQLTVVRLRDRVRRVLVEPQFKQSALRMKDVIARAGGVSRAADIVESAIAAAH